MYWHLKTLISVEVQHPWSKGRDVKACLLIRVRWFPSRRAGIEVTEVRSLQLVIRVWPASLHKWSTGVGEWSAIFLSPEVREALQFKEPLTPDKLKSWRQLFCKPREQAVFLNDLVLNQITFSPQRPQLLQWARMGRALNCRRLAFKQGLLNFMHQIRKRRFQLFEDLEFPEQLIKE